MPLRVILAAGVRQAVQRHLKERILAAVNGSMHERFYNEGSTAEAEQVAAAIGERRSVVERR